MIPTIETIIELILIDQSAIEGIPAVMQERAQYARSVLRNPDGHKIEFGRYTSEAYTFAAWCEEDSRWYDITGHYHAKPPNQVILEREAGKQLRRQKKEIIEELKRLAWQEANIKLDEGAEFLSEHYYNRRQHLPRICKYCGAIETDKKFHWHHLDHTLKWWIDAANEILDTCDPINDPEDYKEAYKSFLMAGYDYHNVPLEDTILLCRSCHTREHAKIRKRIENSIGH